MLVRVTAVIASSGDDCDAGANSVVNSLVAGLGGAAPKTHVYNYTESESRRNRMGWYLRVTYSIDLQAERS